MDAGSRGQKAVRGPVAFLFLGEMLLIPHLYPVVEALAAEKDLRIDLWVSTSVHESLLRKWTAGLGPAEIRIRRAPGYLTLQGYADGRNPPLPPKLPMLLRLVPYLLRTPVVVSAEQTSLWIPTLLPLLPTRFVNVLHGAASMGARDGRRRRAAWRMPVPSRLEQQAYLDRGYDASYVPVVGSVKACFSRSNQRRLNFPEQRPVVLYTPHWQRHRSSWWDWGRELVRQLVEQTRYNVIIAPHQRLIEGDAELRAILDTAAQHPHVHCDIDSFAMVDGSYTAAADIYLGDTSSQVIEFMARPRPCVFLNSHAVAWQSNAEYGIWTCGEVVHSLDQVSSAIDRASWRHSDFAAVQAELVQGWLGETKGAPQRVAGHILEALKP